MIHAKSLIILAIMALWLSLCIIGLSKLAIYDNKPDLANLGPARWPNLGLSRGREYTLVLSIHPQCPCTRATLQELAIALTHCPNLHAYLLFIKPEGASETWVKSDLWSTATKFPHCSLIVDEAGKLSAAFNARSSGQSYMYDPDGQLIYSGGMTPSRGHVGDNAGLDYIIALANRKTMTIGNIPVFGCSLFADNVVCRKESGN
jgi:hypothetical protein